MGPESAEGRPGRGKGRDMAFGKGKGGKRREGPRRPSRVCMVLMTLLAVVLAAVAVVTFVVEPFFGSVNMRLAGKASDDTAVAAQQASADITEEVESEGAILLKNDGVLPMASAGKVNVFGSTVDDLSYGGTGSGSGDTSANVDLYAAFEQAGFEVNPDLKSFYEQNAQSAQDMGVVGTDWNLYELPMSDYPADLLDGAKSYSDTAVVVITRKGGEGFDLPLDMADYTGSEAGRSYLELTPNEEALLAEAEGSYENVVVVLNSPNAMELGFLDNDAIDAALWIGTPGSTGMNAVADILAGKVNPSGRTTDTFAYDVTSAPSYYTMGGHDYTNTSYADQTLFGGTGDAESAGEYHFVNYNEGIYVGYRYYETAAADGFIDYASTVQYPFGYGLSYTTFDQTLDSVAEADGTVTAQVTVTNTGSVAGKDVVQLYVHAPYTQGGIEKPEVQLAAFDKTKLLEPGESQQVTLTFDLEDQASYDYSGIKAQGGAYVLEAGDYEVRLQSNSHDVIASQTINVAADKIYNDANDGARTSDAVTATNQFDDMTEGCDFTMVSRADWAGTFPKEMTPAEVEASDGLKAALDEAFTDDGLEAGEGDDITVANHGLKLSDMAGLDYDDPKWDQLLEQLSVGDMMDLVGNGGWGTHAIGSIGKSFYVDCDGPAGVNNLVAGVNGNQFTGASVVAATWNAELAQHVGEAMGAEAAAYHVAGLYGPACNIHRSPFSGRNFEYPSEDPYISGVITSAEVKGINSKGLYTYVKHLVANDQEANRDNGGLVTWLNEQALREIYLRPFQIVVQDGGTTGIMSSFNRLGATPTAHSAALLKGVLRGEWGFQGCVITDCVMSASTQNIDRSLRAGNDLVLTFLGNMQAGSATKDTVAGHQALREASHNILYMVANSNAAQTAYPMPYSWVVAIRVAQAAIAALFVLYYVRRHKNLKKWRQWHEEHDEQ